MASDDSKHVFVSYVHEDNADVDKLCDVLEAAQIPYWRDRNALGPGEAWKAKIREAIRSGALVFLACFSDNSRAKDASYMNEELTLAVDEFRTHPPGRKWLLPIRFDSGEPPVWDLGAGRTLSDLNYTDLFGEQYAAQAARLVTTIHGVMGQKTLGPAAVLEAVEQATAADRTDLLKRLTKDMVLEPVRRIELDDLVSQEVQRVLGVVTNQGRLSIPAGGSDDERIVKLATRSQALWELTRPFCASLRVAARWGDPESLSPWVSGLRGFVQAANKFEGGQEVILKLRHLPGMVSLMTAGLAGVSSRRWENLKALVVDPTVRDGYDSTPMGLLQATSPWDPFDPQERTPNILARAAQRAEPLGDVLAAINELAAIDERQIPKLHTPVAEWLYHSLRPLFVDQWPDDDAYAIEFDRAEVVLGVLAQDAVNRRIAADPERGRWLQPRWFGRSTWRAANRRANPIGDLRYELETEGSSWGPLRAGLFGGGSDRAMAAIDAYEVHFTEIGGQQH